ncbi:MAG: hypothetical protein DCF28_03500 [Alphaproteobacteria bacterium]|nr:MAG: hypothetical protein DCF28_03500 [Alphaproteobacteria bacterium]PZO39496.1 MAG: hypothetical protein DCE92_04330 [Alphaproteobacteria bacterium]
MFETLPSQIGAAFVVIVCGFAFLKGDEPERFWAGAYILGWFASLLIQASDSILTALSLFAIDVVMLLLLVGLVWKARRTWPAWAAGCQLIVVMSHIVAFTELQSTAAAVVVVISMAGYGVLVALAIGTFWAWQERVAAGLE